MKHGVGLIVVCATLAYLMASISSSVVAQGQDRVDDCDLLAASRLDPTRPKGAPGLDPPRILPWKAEPACRAALKREPDNARFLFELGRVLYASGASDAEAVTLFRRASDAGHPLAPVSLGLLYELGRGVPKDEVKAYAIYREAAGAGKPFAMTNLARLLNLGRGVEKNPAEALKWLQKAAELGDPGALGMLGTAYATGAVLPKNDAKAIELWRAGEAGGDMMSGWSLGLAYARGEQGLERDDAEAAPRLWRALRLGMTPAWKELGQVISRASVQAAAAGSGAADAQFTAMAALGETIRRLAVGISAGDVRN